MDSGRKRTPARTRTVAKEIRREQLIKSTIDSIAKRGFAETTLANVADGAGLSRGIVNFHFRSKEALLVATLEYLADEYRTSWLRALERAGPSPAERLAALVQTDFDAAVCSRKKLAVWHAFYGEAKSRPTYRKLCGQRDREYYAVLREACVAVIREGSYEGVDADRIATGLTAMSDGLWLALLTHWEHFDRHAARDTCLTFLATVFPRHFTEPALSRAEAAP
jgi:TetR/AcrR family transcriptional repressor of bet genes